MSGASQRLSPEKVSWLAAGPLVRLLSELDRDGEEARVVGGAVRKELLRMPIADIDLATTPPPAEVIRRPKSAGHRARPHN